MLELAAELLAERGMAAHPASLSRVLLLAGLESRTRGRAPST